MKHHLVHPHKPPDQRIVIPRAHVGQADVFVVRLAGEPQLVVRGRRLYRVAVGTVAFFPQQVAGRVRLRQRCAADVVVVIGDHVGDDGHAHHGGRAAQIIRIPAIHRRQTVCADAGKGSGQARLPCRDCAVPITFAPSLKVTVPLGKLPVNVAINETGCPSPAGLVFKERCC